jgi:hypothetical protein
MESFTERVKKTDEKEDLKTVDRVGMHLRTTTPIIMTSGAIEKKSNEDDDDELLFPQPHTKEPA